MGKNKEGKKNQMVNFNEALSQAQVNESITAFPAKNQPGLGFFFYPVMSFVKPHSATALLQLRGQ